MNRQEKINNLAKDLAPYQSRYRKTKLWQRSISRFNITLSL
jgi:hypothetical protein